MRIWTHLFVLAVSCSGPPHSKSEAEIRYRAAFQAEPGVNCRVSFPLPAAPLGRAIVEAMTVSDGGQVSFDTSLDDAGVLLLEGRGNIEANYTGIRSEGLGEGGIPEGDLTLRVPDGGMGSRFVKVNKGGSPSVPLQFGYSLKRQCGANCGGSRGWTFEGPVGLSVQEVLMTFSEEKAK